MAIATAIIAAAVIGAAATVYTAEKQEDIANEERRRLEREEEERKAEAERIAKETRPYGEELSAITFGAGEGGAAMGSTSDFLVTKTAGSLGTSGGSGLGFNV